ncbi:uncharacterized protein HMPREF1541_02624 [Cyphellophora europaea CBS 101466]|uniref:Clr5 domain-containing protein n=1 Tax=Cyphellophora europaea (strain CBS 101466) TaxID=1220924 RepID=W2S4F2_CYPE1|nr:uncharacterized protein HMPREF1541_02624 [Cyphellophora europaea CBS 101466]ETN43465.1 hypothetical protein HMPREF1541_02624 [Cyphellophora europaea CBS 101466]
MPPRSISSRRAQPQPRHSVEAWAQRRDLITSLYSDDNLTVGQVRTILDEDHGFRATERQFRRKFKEWNLDKNIKDSEMRTMLCVEYMRRESDGKESTFEIWGRLVDPRKLQRFAQRKAESAPDLLTANHTAVLPDHITCHTPIDEDEAPFDDLEDLHNCSSDPMSTDMQKSDPRAGATQHAAVTDPAFYSDEETIMFGPSFSEGSEASTERQFRSTFLVDRGALSRFWEPFWQEGQPSNDIRSANGARAHHRGGATPQPQTSVATTGTNSSTLASNAALAAYSEGPTMPDLASALEDVSRAQQSIFGDMNSLYQSQDRLRDLELDHRDQHARLDNSIGAILGFLTSEYGRRPNFGRIPR